MRHGLLLTFFFTIFTSCSTNLAVQNKSESILFSRISSDYKLTDQNNYGCKTIDSSSIEHILETGKIVSQREVHDYFSTTGCSIKGTLSSNGKTTSFVFDYGGLFYFEDGMILGCTETCCIEGFTYCTYDKDDLKGF